MQMEREKKENREAYEQQVLSQTAGAAAGGAEKQPAFSIQGGGSETISPQAVTQHLTATTPVSALCLTIPCEAKARRIGTAIAVMLVAVTIIPIAPAMRGTQP
jgi:hypothetical protein